MEKLSLGKTNRSINRKQQIKIGNDLEKIHITAPTN
jgi:hypothetical protein